MKALAIFLFLIPIVGFAQQSNVFKIDSLPKQGILLDKGWKWHAGDNPNFAKPDFDDSGWQGIDPTLTIPEIHGIEKNTSIWLRINLETTKSTEFTAAIKQSVASEIYLNGRILKSYGKIDSLGIKTVAYMPVDNYLILKLDSSKNTLAVRIFFQKGLRYKRFTSLTYPLFSMQLFDENNTSKQLYARDYIWEGFNIGFPFILFLVYFTIFIFYTPNKSALWFSLWGFFSSYFLNTLTKITPDLALQNEYTFYSAIVSAIATISLVYSIYLLLHQKKLIFLSSFTVLTALSTIYYFTGSGETQYMVDFTVTLFYVVIVVLMGKNALKQGNVGGKYVIFGIVFFIVLWAIFLFDLVTDGKDSIVTDIIFHLAVLSLPVMVAALLGLDFKNKNKSLLKNIEEVRKLASEKQQILATQNETLERQVEARTAELKASQAQLIQKEKLASLGELTAGIAHEIQNPLNFVNNFSEMSVELVSELLEERNKEPGKRDEELEKELLNDLAQNQQKINLHGKRASSIVSGMLEHSRTSTGEKALTDINKLADEYLRLSYHGIRAKDSSFNSDYKTDFDENLPKIEVIPQDMGRVILNLINNAFWAVKTVEKPLVVVTTSRTEKQIIIKVSDNGIGITDEVKTKIFQPFFTTKPTGEGTGLGLSLAYDIVTKGHSGTIECESVEGEGTTFMVKLEN